MIRPISPLRYPLAYTRRVRLPRSGPPAGALGNQLSALERRRQLRKQQEDLQAGLVDYLTIPPYPSSTAAAVVAWLPFAGDCPDFRGMTDIPAEIDSFAAKMGLSPSPRKRQPAWATFHYSHKGGSHDRRIRNSSPRRVCHSWTFLPLAGRSARSAARNSVLKHVARPSGKRVVIFLFLGVLSPHPRQVTIPLYCVMCECPDIPQMAIRPLAVNGDCRALE